MIAVILIYFLLRKSNIHASIPLLFHVFDNINWTENCNWNIETNIQIIIKKLKDKKRKPQLIKESSIIYEKNLFFL